MNINVKSKRVDQSVTHMARSPSFTCSRAVQGFTKDPFPNDPVFKIKLVRLINQRYRSA